jgi:hypothetical protein
MCATMPGKSGTSLQEILAKQYIALGVRDRALVSTWTSVKGSYRQAEAWNPSRGPVEN